MACPNKAEHITHGVGSGVIGGGVSWEAPSQQPPDRCRCGAFKSPDRPCVRCANLQSLLTPYLGESKAKHLIDQIAQMPDHQRANALKQALGNKATENQIDGWMKAYDNTNHQQTTKKEGPTHEEMTAYQRAREAFLDQAGPDALDENDELADGYEYMAYTPAYRQLAETKSAEIDFYLAKDRFIGFAGPDSIDEDGLLTPGFEAFQNTPIYQPYVQSRQRYYAEMGMSLADVPEGEMRDGKYAVPTPLRGGLARTGLSQRDMKEVSRRFSAVGLESARQQNDAVKQRVADILKQEGLGHLIDDVNAIMTGSKAGAKVAKDARAKLEQSENEPKKRAVVSAETREKLRQAALSRCRCAECGAFMSAESACTRCSRLRSLLKTSGLSTDKIEQLIKQIGGAVKQTEYHYRQRNHRLMKDEMSEYLAVTGRGDWVASVHGVMDEHLSEPSPAQIDPDTISVDALVDEKWQQIYGKLSTDVPRIDVRTALDAAINSEFMYSDPQDALKNVGVQARGILSKWQQEAESNQNKAIDELRTALTRQTRLEKFFDASPFITGTELDGMKAELGKLGWVIAAKGEEIRDEQAKINAYIAFMDDMALNVPHTAPMEVASGKITPVKADTNITADEATIIAEMLKHGESTRIVGNKRYELSWKPGGTGEFDIYSWHNPGFSSVRKEFVVATEQPTENQAPAPTEQPTENQAPAPTEQPTESQAPAPTEQPTESQAPAPTEQPTESQALAPTEQPTESQTLAPTEGPGKVKCTRCGAYISPDHPCQRCATIGNIESLLGGKTTDAIYATTVLMDSFFRSLNEFPLDALFNTEQLLANQGALIDVFDEYVLDDADPRPSEAFLERYDNDPNFSGLLYELVLGRSEDYLEHKKTPPPLPENQNTPHHAPKKRAKSNAEASNASKKNDSPPSADKNDNTDNRPELEQIEQDGERNFDAGEALVPSLRPKRTNASNADASKKKKNDSPPSADKNDNTDNRPELEQIEQDGERNFDEGEEMFFAPSLLPKRTNDRNYRISAEDRLGEGGLRTKAKQNLSAIKVLKQLEAEKRSATDEEKAILVKYVGWGGLPNAFSYEPDWLAYTQELKATLTPEEWQSARSSTLNAHYTSPKVIKSMWAAIEHLGYAEGRVLEPSAGIGHFVGLAPTDIATNSEFHAVELDSITGRILGQLYPDANVTVDGFERTKYADNTFDLAIGNVPFGSYGVVDPDYRSRPYLSNRIHNYFFAKSLDKVKPGGMVAFITSRHTLDAESRSNVREYLASQADFVGAIRLPSTAFKENANTEVTTDIIFLRKRAEGDPPASFNQSWIETSRIAVNSVDHDRKVNTTINTYFDQHPEMILGTMTAHGSMYSRSSIECSDDGRDLEAALAEAIQKLPRNIATNAAAMKRCPVCQAFVADDGVCHNPNCPTNRDMYVTAPPQSREGSYIVKDGELFRAAADGQMLRVQDPNKESVSAQADVIRKWRACVDVIGDEKALNGRNLLPKYKSLYGKNAAFIEYQQAYDLESKLKSSADKYQRICAIAPIAETTRELVRCNATQVGDDELNGVRHALNTQYDAFVSKYGYLNDPNNKDAFEDDPDALLLTAIEHYVPVLTPAQAEKEGVPPRSKSSATKADIFNKRVIRISHRPDKADSAKDALLITLNETSTLHWERMEKLTGRRKEALIAELMAQDLVFETPSGEWQTTETYLSGNVRKKLAEATTAAKQDPRYDRNVEALLRVQPRSLSASEIHVGFGAGWVNKRHYEQFFRHLLRGRVYARYIEELGAWSIDGSAVKYYTENQVEWGTPNAPATRLIDDALNNRLTTIKKNAGYDENGQAIMVVDEAETALARQKQADIKRAWNEWIWQDETRAEELTGVYNTRFNSVVTRKYTGEHLTFPGMATDAFELRKHQKNAVWRILQSKSTLLAHRVGAGKTAEMICATMELRRTNPNEKVVISVPNHLPSQFAKEFLELYPTARILVIDSKKLNAEQRKETLNRIATNDWDVVISSHDAMKRIPVDRHTEITHLTDEQELLRTQLEELGKEQEQDRYSSGRTDETRKRTIKQIENAIAKLSTKITKLAASPKDDVLTWEQLGITTLMVDEAHMGKNLFTATSMTNVAGVKANSGSSRATDLKTKGDYVRRKCKCGAALPATGICSRCRENTVVQEGRLVFATATPLTNSIGEMHVMQRYLGAETLKETGLGHFDAWVNQFANTVPQLEMKPSGKGYRVKVRLAQFNNVPELIKMFHEFADVQLDAEQLNIPLPLLDGADSATYDMVKKEFIDFAGSPDAINKYDKLSKSFEHLRETPEYQRFDDARREFRRPVVMANKMSAEQKQFIEACDDRASRLQGVRAEKGGDNILTVMNDARACSIDLRLVSFDALKRAGIDTGEEAYEAAKQEFADKTGVRLTAIGSLPESAAHLATSPHYAEFLRAKDDWETMAHLDHPDSKINTFVKQALTTYRETTGVTLRREDMSPSTKFTPDMEGPQNMSQIVFLDSGVPGGASFDLYGDIKRKLIKGGVPPEEIAFIHDATNDQERNTLFKKVSAGQVRFLLGSTAKMGTGMNVQKRLIEEHNLDVPWRPDQLIQRGGRMERQGNVNAKIRRRQYVTEESFDAYLLQTVQSKSSFINAVMNGDDSIRRMDDIDETTLTFAHLKAAASNSPELMEKVDLETKIAKLSALQRGWRDNQSALGRQAAKIPSQREMWKKELSDIRLARAAYDKSPTRIQGQTYEKWSDTAGALQKLVRAMPMKDVEDGGAFTSHGATIQLSRRYLRSVDSDRYDYLPMAHISLGGRTTTVELHNETAESSLRRIDNAVRRLRDGSNAIDEWKRSGGAGGNKLPDDVEEQIELALRGLDAQERKVNELLGKPFGQAGELEAMNARLFEIEKKMRADEIAMSVAVDADESAANDGDDDE